MKIKTITNKKDTPVYGLEKIPDEVIIQELRLEMGKLNAYIEELEFELKTIKADREGYILKLENTVKSLKNQMKPDPNSPKQISKSKEIINLKKTISDLLCKMNKNEYHKTT